MLNVESKWFVVSCGESFYSSHSYLLVIMNRSNITDYLFMYTFVLMSGTIESFNTLLMYDLDTFVNLARLYSHNLPNTYVILATWFLRKHDIQNGYKFLFLHEITLEVHYSKTTMAISIPSWMNWNLPWNLRIGLLEGTVIRDCPYDNWQHTICNVLGLV